MRATLLFCLTSICLSVPLPITRSTSVTELSDATVGIRTTGHAGTGMGTSNGDYDDGNDFAEGKDSAEGNFDDESEKGGNDDDDNTEDTDTEGSENEEEEEDDNIKTVHTILDDGLKVSKGKALDQDLIYVV